MNEEENKRLGEALISLGKGNAAALENVASAMQKMLYAIGNAYFDNQADVEDAVQELYLLLNKRAKKFHNNFNAKAWIIRVYKNYVLDKKAKITRENELLSEYSRERLNGLAGSEEYIEKHLFLRDIQAFLTRTEWELFIYSQWCGYTIREIAKIMHMPKTTVEYKLKKLREKFDKQQ